MQNEFEQIRRELHDLRNHLSPINATLDFLDFQMKKNKTAHDIQIAALEARITELTKRIESRAPASPTTATT